MLRALHSPTYSQGQMFGLEIGHIKIPMVMRLWKSLKMALIRTML